MNNYSRPIQVLGNIGDLWFHCRTSQWHHLQLEWFTTLFQPTASLPGMRTLYASRLTRSRSNRCRVCSTVLRPQIHLPTTDSPSFEEPEAIIWKICDRSLITQTRVDYSMKMSATCESFLPAIKATILSCLITWTVIGDLLEKFCKAVMMRMSMLLRAQRNIHFLG